MNGRATWLYIMEMSIPPVTRQPWLTGHVINSDTIYEHMRHEVNGGADAAASLNHVMSNSGRTRQHSKIT